MNEAIETEEVFNFESEIDFLFVEPKNQRIQCSIYLDSSDEIFHDAATAHCSETDSFTTLKLLFPVSHILDGIIDNYSPFPNKTSIEAKPELAMLRAELVEIIERIDNMIFTG